MEILSLWKENRGEKKHLRGSLAFTKPHGAKDFAQSTSVIINCHDKSSGRSVLPAGTLTDESHRGPQAFHHHADFTEEAFKWRVVIAGGALSDGRNVIGTFVVKVDVQKANRGCVVLRVVGTSKPQQW